MIVKQRENREQVEIFSIEEFVPAEYVTAIFICKILLEIPLLNSITYGLRNAQKKYTIMKEIMRQNERKKGLENEQYLFEQRNIYDDNTDDHLFKDPLLYYMEPE